MRRMGAAFVLTLACSGCGTLIDTVGDRRGKQDGISNVRGGRVRIYGGMRYDCEVLYEAKAGFLLAFFALDVPISFAIDTVLLPFTVPYNLFR